MLVTPIHTLALMIMVFSPCDSFTPPTAKLDIQADMILVVGRTDFNTLRKEILAVFPSYFQVAEDKVRLGALFVSDAGITNIVDLTGDVTQFTKALQKFVPTGPKTKPIMDVSEIMKTFDGVGRSEIPKVVDHIYRHIVANVSWNKTRVAKANDSGQYCHAVIPLNDTQLFKMVPECGQFGEALMKLLCGQNQDVCTFDESGACISYPSGIIPIDPLECRKFPGLKHKPCNRATCENVCDITQLLNVTEACSEECGTIQLNVTSSDILEAQKKMQSRCPAHFQEIQCANCTGTPLTKATKKLPSTGSPKTVPKISISPSTQQKPSTGFSPHGVSTTKNSSSPTADLKNSSGVSPKPESFPWWIIGVVAAVVAIVLLGITAAVVITRRRRMQKESAPVSEKTSTPVPTPKSKVEVEGRKAVSASVGGESAGVSKGEESVGVSLKEDSTQEIQKAAGSSNKGSGKGKDQASDKSNEKSNRAVSKVGKGSTIATGPKKA